MNNSSIKNIVICGNGLAGALSALAISKALPKTTKLTLIDTLCTHEKDIFYGNITSASTYAFLLNLGISEIEVLTQTNTSFSLGTHYNNWGEEKNTWYQCQHQPLPVLQGVMFHHYLTRISAKDQDYSEIGPYIMSVCAAKNGVFAHPSQDPKSPLKNIEYGYHFQPKELRKLINKKLDGLNIKIEKGSIETADKSDGKIRSLRLSSGATISGDFFIDCTDGNSKINEKMSMLGNSQTLEAAEHTVPSNQISDACRRVHGSFDNWTSKIFLQDKLHTLNITNVSDKIDRESKYLTSNSKGTIVKTGFVEKPWRQNCLRLGLSAAILSPITPAPIMLLLKDIERMLELIPISHDMKVEGKEYNRRFREDYIHASAFENALKSTQTIIRNESFDNKIEELIYEKLKRKIVQFKSRGVILQYDLEPFNNEDWTQIHLGMGRVPDRYDPLADKIEENQLIGILENIKLANNITISKMPPLKKYMTGLIKYLRNKNEKI